MKRFSMRWQQVLPRLLLVIVAVMGGQYALGLAARWIAVRSGTEALATKVDIANARCSILDRQLVLRELRIANPCRPSENLLTADRCELDFELGPLWHKQAIIDRGRVTGLRLGDLANEAATACAKPKSQAARNWLGADADEQAREWLELLIQRFKQQSTDRFESLERSEAVCARWPGEWAGLDERAAELKRRAIELQEATDAAEANRLRHAEFFRALPRKTSALRQEFDDFGAEIEEVAVSMEAERRAIIAALQRDEKILREGLRLEPMDADSLTVYLLRTQLAESLDELTGWLRGTRQILSAEATGPSRQQRGEDVLFAGCRPAPNFLIRELHLNGTARVGTQSAKVRGVLTDVTNMPSRHVMPTRLRLTSAGSLPLELQVTIDRTGAVARDEVLMDCHCVALREISLGGPGGLELKLGPSTGSLSISVAVDGDKLSGDIQLVQRQVRITPVMQGDLAGIPLVAPLQATLGKVNSVATRVSLHGTLDEPSCTLWSNLGPAVAEAMARAVRRAGEEHASAVLADTRRAVDERLADLERQFAEQRTSFAAELAGVGVQLDTIARRQTSRERISADQLGRRLPENSLFR